MLLSDWVFTQQPVSVRRVVSFVASKVGFRMLLAAIGQNRRVSLALPERCGQKELQEVCKAAYRSAARKDEYSAIGSVLAENLDSKGRLDYWLSEGPQPGGQVDKWLALGSALDVYEMLTPQQADSLATRYGASFIGRLGDGGRFDLLESNEQIFDEAVGLALRGASLPPPPGGRVRQHAAKRAPLLLQLYFVLHPHLYQHVFRGAREAPLWNIFLQGLREFGSLKGLETAESVEEKFSSDNLPKCARFLSAFKEVAEKPVGIWAESLTPWSKLLDSGTREWGNSRIFAELAAIAAGIRSKTEIGRIGSDLADSNVPISERARFARLRSGATRWWSDQLVVASGEADKFFELICVLVWGSPRTIIQVGDLISELVDALPPLEWSELFGSIERVLSFDPERRARIDSKLLRSMNRLSPRVLAVLITRSGHLSAEQILDGSLRDYSGKDTSVWSSIVDIALLRAVREGTWRDALTRVKRAYDNGVTTSSSAWSFQVAHAEIVPFNVAKEICRDANKYPLYILDAAEASLTKAAKLKVKAVGTLANQQRWFMN